MYRPGMSRVEAAPELGEVLSHYQRSAPSLGGPVITAAIPSGCALLVTSGLGVTWIGYIVTAVFTGFAVFLYVEDLRHAGNTLYIQSGGLSGRYGKTTFAWPWSEIKLRRSHTLTQYKTSTGASLGEQESNFYQLRAGDESASFGDEFIGAEVLCDEIEGHLGRHQLEPTIARMEAGERVEFGAMWISRDAIGTSDATLPWQQVAGIRVEAGQVAIVDTAGATAMAKPFSSLDNAGLLFGIIAQLKVTGDTAR